MLLVFHILTAQKSYEGSSHPQTIEVADDDDEDNQAESHERYSVSTTSKGGCRIQLISFFFLAIQIYLHVMFILWMFCFDFCILTSCMEITVFLWINLTVFCCLTSLIFCHCSLHTHFTAHFHLYMYTCILHHCCIVVLHSGRNAGVIKHNSILGSSQTLHTCCECPQSGQGRLEIC